MKFLRLILLLLCGCLSASAQTVPCDTLFTDPGFDQNYLPFTNISQQISIDPSYRIMIDFTTLELGPGDTLQITDALFPNQPSLALLTEASSIQSVFAYSNTVLFQFNSDSAGEAAGYVFTIKCFEAYQFHFAQLTDSLCSADTLQFVFQNSFPQSGPYTIRFLQEGQLVDSLNATTLSDTNFLDLPGSLVGGNYTLVLSPQSALWAPLSDSVAFFIQQQPQTPVISGDSVYCGGIAWLQTAPADSLQWIYNSTALQDAFSSFVEVTEPGQYQVASSNVCGTVLSDTFFLELTPLPDPPQLSISGNQQICVGDSLFITFNPWDSGAILFLNNNPLAPSDSAFWAVQSGQYHVERSNACGISRSDTLILSLLQAPEPFSIDANGPLSFCEGNSVLIQPSLNLEASFNWLFNGDTLSLTSPSISASQDGIYTLLASNDCGTTPSLNSLEVQVQENPPVPVISAAGPTTLCEGNSAVLLVDVPENTVFSWFRNGQTLNQQVEQLQVSESGNYTVITTNSCGSAQAEQSIQVQINPLPEPPLLFAQGNPFLCDGSNVLIGTAAQTGVTWQWKRNATNIPSSTNSVVVNQPGTYTLLVTNGCGSVASLNQIEVQSGNPPVTPTIQTTGATSFCEGLSVTLTTPPQPGILIEWLRNGQPSGLNDYQIQATEAGIWSVRVSNACDTLQSTQSVQVTVFPLPPSVNIQYTGETSICEGDSLNLSIDPLANVSYQWRRNGTVVGPNAPEFTATVEGLYQIVLANNCGSTPSANTIYLNVDSIQPVDPELLAMPGPALCPGGYVLLNAPPVDFQQYSWYLNGVLIEGFNGPVLQATEWGTYTVQSGNACGISGTSSGVTLGPGDPPPPFELYSENDETEFCSNDSLTITAQVPFGVSVRWYWNNVLLVEGDAQITVSEPGSYTADAWNGCGESDASNALQLNTLPAPVVPVILQNDNQLTTNSVGTLQWLNAALDPISGATSNSFFPPAISATYFVEVTAENGCSSISEPFNWVVDGIHTAVRIGKVFPNPTQGNAVFQTTIPQQNLQLINAMGLVVRIFPEAAFQTTSVLELTGIAPGYYWLKSELGIVPLVVSP